MGVGKVEERGKGRERGWGLVKWRREEKGEKGDGVGGWVKWRRKER